MARGGAAGRRGWPRLLNVHEHRHFQKWEAERKRILDRMNEEKMKKRLKKDKKEARH